MIKQKYTYGPVPSRRLGFSLGIDIVPFKTCSFDCIYCQLGRTTNKTIERKAYVGTAELSTELKAVLKDYNQIDYITFSGSGEPTLNSEIGQMIQEIKKITSIPVAVLTNGFLLSKENIQDELLSADLVVPSLDTVTPEIFQRINRPYDGIEIGRIIEGLKDFGQKFNGKIWLEIMLVKGVNDKPDELIKIKDAVKQLKLDKMQLNTVTRPPSEELVRPLEKHEMLRIKELFGNKCEVIGEFVRKAKEFFEGDIEPKIMDIIKRRPVTILDISSLLGMHLNEAIKIMRTLEREHKVGFKTVRNIRYYHSIH
jgi:wyosine [tRNA(Phe)-imidazoG37] synthetase (radical SAM superfamily)